MEEYIEINGFKFKDHKTFLLCIPIHNITFIDSFFESLGISRKEFALKYGGSIYDSFPEYKCDSKEVINYLQSLSHSPNYEVY